MDWAWLCLNFIFSILSSTAFFLFFFFLKLSFKIIIFLSQCFGRQLNLSPPFYTVFQLF